MIGVLSTIVDVMMGTVAGVYLGHCISAVVFAWEERRRGRPGPPAMRYCRNQEN